jgi:hypothetical protein
VVLQRFYREIFDAFTERKVEQHCWRDRDLTRRQWKKI